MWYYYTIKAYVWSIIIGKGAFFMKEKIFVGKLEFDKEEMEVLQNALIFYKNTYKNKAEICDYLLSELKHLKQEDF